MNDQEALVLTILGECNEGRLSGHTRFQKLVFLSQQRAETGGPFSFKPYDYGPYDNELRSTLESLEGDKLSMKKIPFGGGKTRYDYRLEDNDVVDSAKAQLPDELVEAVEEVVSEFEEKPLMGVLNYVYEQYPKYAKNSVI